MTVAVAGMAICGGIDARAGAPADSTAKTPRLTVGGYGEVAFSRNFYSDNVYRYSSAAKHRDEAHNRFDIPHAVIYLGYDFGRGWSMQTEIEFEHPGVEAESEKEFEEAGEWEKELERGGAVELEQFWIQKSIAPWLNVRAGHIVVPVGGLNKRHEPLNFFTVYRPEGEFTVLPSTWHDTGLGVWGKIGSWRYEAMVVSGLDAMMFSRDNFIGKGAGTPFGFQVANKPGFAGRIDKTFRFGRRLPIEAGNDAPSHILNVGVSGYAGQTLGNTFPYEELTASYIKGAKGELLVGALDFNYASPGRRVLVRGNADYGHLNDAGAISKYKSAKGAASGAPYSDTPVGDWAYAVGLEAGVNVLPARLEDKLYVFVRGDRYDSYVAESGQGRYDFTFKRRIAAGINWMPIPQIAVKAEYSHRLLPDGYNNEPSISLGIAYMAFFTR